MNATIAVVLLLLARTLSASDASAVPAVAYVQRAYLDQQQRVHVVDGDGHDRRVSGRPGIELTVAPDRGAVAWLAVGKRGEASSDQLRVYRHGRTQRITCGPFITEFRFRQGSRNIALSCSGPHFAGWQRLYDVETLALLAEFDEGAVPFGKRPSWSVDSE